MIFNFFRKLKLKRDKLKKMYLDLWNIQIEVERYLSLKAEQEEILGKMESKLETGKDSQQKYEIQKKIKEQQEQLEKTKFLLNGGIDKKDSKEKIGLLEQEKMIKSYVEAVKKIL